MSEGIQPEVRARLKTLLAEFWQDDWKKMAKECGVSNQTLKHVLKGSCDRNQAIKVIAGVKKHNTISSQWIDLGIGPMRRFSGMTLPFVATTPNLEQATSVEIPASVIKAVQSEHPTSPAVFSDRIAKLRSKTDDLDNLSEEELERLTRPEPEPIIQKEAESVPQPVQPPQPVAFSLDMFLEAFNRLREFETNYNQILTQLKAINQRFSDIQKNDANLRMLVSADYNKLVTTTTANINTIDQKCRKEFTEINNYIDEKFDDLTRKVDEARQVAAMDLVAPLVERIDQLTAEVTALKSKQGSNKVRKEADLDPESRLTIHQWVSFEGFHKMHFNNKRTNSVMGRALSGAYKHFEIPMEIPDESSTARATYLVADLRHYKKWYFMAAAESSDMDAEGTSFDSWYAYFETHALPDWKLRLKRS